MAFRRSRVQLPYPPPTLKQTETHLSLANKGLNAFFAFWGYFCYTWRRAEIKRPITHTSTHTNSWKVIKRSRVQRHSSNTHIHTHINSPRNHLDFYLSATGNAFVNARALSQSPREWVIGIPVHLPPTPGTDP